jgi:hypothetical protein
MVLPKTWQELVNMALSLDHYDTEEQIKEDLSKRFRHTHRVNGHVPDWYTYLVRLDEIQTRNQLIFEWSTLFQIAQEKEIQVEPIDYNIGIDIFKEKVDGLKNLVGQDKEIEW